MEKPSGGELLRLNREGLSYSAIGKRYNLTRGQVAGMINRAKESERAGESAAKELPAAENLSSERITIEQEGNTCEVESRSTRITTLEQLITHCKIDLDVWMVERHVINKWEVGRRAESKDLTWVDGIITGNEKDTGGFLIEPLFQVKATLVKRRPEPIKPVIQPIHIYVGAPPVPSERKHGLKAALIISDIQFGFSRDVLRGGLTPFHDRRALDCVLQIARAIQPDTTVFLGDVNDFSGWSDKYIRQPEFYFTTQPALIEAAWYIGQIRQATSGPVYDLEGNHEQRPEKQIIAHLVDAYGLRSADQLDAAPVLSVDNLLGLSRMGVTYVNDYPDGEVWINATTRCIHGEKVRGQPGLTAAAVVRDANENTIYGHIHRREMATKTIPCRGGYRTVTAYSPGCLCHCDGRVPGSTRSNQWQQGAAVVWYNEETSTIVPVDIYNGQAMIGGEIYQGRDYVGELKQQTGWAF